MRIQGNGGQSIESVEAWERFAPPKSKSQWKKGRSAFELASAWCGLDGHTPAMPSDLRGLLDSRPETAGMQVDCVLPEHRIRFDTRGGEPRNADLAFVGQTDDGSVAVTVEAKADEPFGATIAETACAAIERHIVNPRSRGVERVMDLAASLLPPWTKGLQPVNGLYYQLFTAVAGSLAYAIEHKATMAVLVIHEFATSQTDDAKHTRNNEAYADFIRRLHGQHLHDEEMKGLVGPFTVPGLPLFRQPPPLLVGKLTTNRREP